MHFNVCASEIRNLNSEMYLGPDGKNAFSLMLDVFLFPLFFCFGVVKNEQGAFVEAERVEVIGELVEALLVGCWAVPHF